LQNRREGENLFAAVCHSLNNVRPSGRACSLLAGAGQKGPASNDPSVYSGWKTFLRNHADGIAAVDFLVVPTLTFERLGGPVELVMEAARNNPFRSGRL
jgi:hypothetical protein